MLIELRNLKEVAEAGSNNNNNNIKKNYQLILWINYQDN